MSNPNLLSKLVGDDVVELGVALAAATIAKMTPRDATSPFCVHLWIPLGKSFRGAFMNFSSPVEPPISDCTFMSTLSELVSSQPLGISTVGHDDAKRVFTEQCCPLTAARIGILNQSAYRCWTLGSYFGLLNTHHQLLTDVWMATAAVCEGAVRSPTITLRNWYDTVKFIFPSVGGVLIVPAAASFDDVSDTQVLSIALKSLLCDGRMNASVSARSKVDAELIAESEMRFSSRIYEFASNFTQRRGVSAEARDTAQIRDDGVAERGQILLCTGPSASGKTTFANRLSLALRAYGYSPISISMDEYYRDSKSDPNYPKNPDGTPNHELVECLNLEQLKDDIQTLLEYGEVELPEFDMVQSKPKPKTGKHFVSLPRGGKPVIVLEGIFALDPTWVKMIESETITKLFVMPIATTGVTELATVKNQDIRLIRRISRDFLHRGRNARASIARLPGVEKGENEGIFPLLRNADYVFNTFIDFEIGLLRVYISPLLRQIEPTDATYGRGQQLTAMLDGVQSVSDRTISKDSLVREFIGGSLFEMKPLSVHFDNRAGQLTGRRFSFRGKGAEMAAAASSVGLMKRQSAKKGLTVADALLVQDGQPAGTPFKAEKDSAVAVLNNRVVVGLNCPLEGTEYFHGASIRPLPLSSLDGLAAYDETAILMLHAAVKKVLGHRRRLVVWHRFVEEGDRFAIRVLQDNELVAVSLAERDAIMAMLSDFSREDEDIVVHVMNLASAVETFLSHHMPDTVRLLESSSRPSVQVASLGGIPSLKVRPTLPTCGFVAADSVSLVPHNCEGDASRTEFVEWVFTVNKSDVGSSSEVETPLFASTRFPISTQAAHAVCRTRDEAHSAHRISTVGDVNHSIFEGCASTLVSVDEALEFRYLFELYRRVEATRARIVYVAGSSSSGKSVIAAQLRQLLAAHGYAVSTMATDDYYRLLSEESYPTFSNGEKNTECVEALRLELLGEHLRKIVVEGVDVTDGPTFDCGTGVILSQNKRIRSLCQSEVKSVLIVEGLFALCPRVHALVDTTIPILRVLVHPIPLLNLDELHLISASQLRLLRRCARDYYVRGRTARETLQRRHFVQDGEVLNTLPFVEQADVIVNASCVYELAAIRTTTEMLLNFVPDSLTDGGDAIRCASQLKELLSWVCGMPESRLPARRFVQLLVDPESEVS